MTKDLNLIDYQRFYKIIHFIPATHSCTATLLRLYPNYKFLNGFYKEPSSKINSLYMTGNVYKVNILFTVSF